MQFFWGVLFADIQNHDTIPALLASRPRTSALLSTVFVLLGLTFASFPEIHPEWMAWSRFLTNAMEVIRPSTLVDLPRLGSGLGLNFLTLGILFSPSVLQRALASKYLLFFGRLSFAVYLLHGPLLRTTLVWMLYGVHAPPEGQVDLYGIQMPAILMYPGNMTLLACLLVWLPMLFGLAHLWTVHVDTWCDRMTNRLVEHVRLEANEKISVLPTS